MTRKHLATLLKLLFVGALMGWVLSKTPWQDSYHVKREGADTQITHGRILGPWDGREVRFVEQTGVEKTLRSGEQPDGSTLILAPGLPTYWRNLDFPLFLLGALCYLVSVTFGMARWWWLLRVNDLPVGFWTALRFSWIGVFFNNIVPGQTGGDLIKAVYVMKRCPNDRVAALVSVIVDRVMGLGSLSLLAAVAVLFYLDDDDFRGLALAIWGVLTLVLLLGAIAFSRRIRKAVRLPQMINRMPGGLSHLMQRLDKAVFFYRGHKSGMAFWMLAGMASHGVNVLCIYFIGEALGMGVPVQDYFVLTPVILIVSAIPIGPNGWGVGEAMFGYLFKTYSAKHLAMLHAAQTMYARGVSLSLLYRLHLTLWSLLGGLILGIAKDRVSRAEVEHEVALEQQEETREGSAETTDGASQQGADQASSTPGPE